jgi:tyrosyl-tRNA synthetase
MVVEGNGMLSLVEFILLPAAELKGKREFRVERGDEEPPLVYNDIKQMHEDYTKDIVGRTPSMSDLGTLSLINIPVLVNTTTP